MLLAIKAVNYAKELLSTVLLATQWLENHIFINKLKINVCSSVLTLNLAILLEILAMIVKSNVDYVMLMI